MSSLYEVTGDLLQLQSMLEEDDVDPEVLAGTLEAVQGEYEIKLESCCKVIKNLEADVVGVKAEVDRLTGKRKGLENNIDRLKKAMFNSMKATDTPKIKGQLFTVAIQKNGGKIPVIVASDADTSKLPDKLVIVTEKANLDAIREALEAGKTVEGYSLGERGESLRIK